MRAHSAPSVRTFGAHLRCAPRLTLNRLQRVSRSEASLRGLAPARRRRARRSRQRRLRRGACASALRCAASPRSHVQAQALAPLALALDARLLKGALRLAPGALRSYSLFFWIQYFCFSCAQYKRAFGAFNAASPRKPFIYRVASDLQRFHFRPVFRLVYSTRSDDAGTCTK